MRDGLAITIVGTSWRVSKGSDPAVVWELLRAGSFEHRGGSL